MKTIVTILILFFISTTPVNAARLDLKIQIDKLHTGATVSNLEKLGLRDIKENIHKHADHLYKPIIKNNMPEYASVWKNIITVHLNSSKKK